MPRQRINYRRTIHHFPNDFPRSLERFKDASGLTWGEMARRLGTNTLTLRRWRAGTRPNALHLLALLDVRRLTRYRIPDSIGRNSEYVSGSTNLPQGESQGGKQHVGKAATV